MFYTQLLDHFILKNFYKLVSYNITGYNLTPLHQLCLASAAPKFLSWCTADSSHSPEGLHHHGDEDHTCQPSAFPMLGHFLIEPDREHARPWWQPC